MQIINGKETAALLKQQIKTDAEQYESSSGRKPHLAAVLVGNNGASETYIKSKIKNCKEVGFDSTLVTYDNDVTEKELIAKVEELNNNPDIDGILVQLPLPKHINADAVTDAINYRKDVDGFHPINLGRLMRGQKAFVSATPLGIMLLLKQYNIKTEGKHCVVIGRSNIVGTPVSVLLSRNAYPGNCTVTLVHSKTDDIAAYTSQADIIIAAVGKKHFLTGAMVKPGCTIIDVGINREESTETKSGYRLFGDVDFDDVSTKAAHITPVPNGVGPMTIVALLTNTLMAAKKEIYP